MSRSNYDECCSGWDLIRWRGAVSSAIRGARGQELLREMAAALDAMPVKRLIKESLQTGGEVCALGAVGVIQGIDMSRLDPEEPEQVARAFRIAPALAQEIVWVNDEWFTSDHETPEQRWVRVRKWVEEQIKS
jgi:hypothetical protein